MYLSVHLCRLIHIQFILKIIASILLIIALARPQSTSSWQDTTTEGIDIVLSMDISGSMLAEDLKPNRLEASKDVALSFISKRIYDRIGLVIFSGKRFTQCPLTTDHNVLVNLFKDIKTFINLLGIYKKVKPDIVCHFTVKPNIYGSIAARVFKVSSLNKITGLGT